jgi:hypothetical protein
MNSTWQMRLQGAADGFWWDLKALWCRLTGHREQAFHTHHDFGVVETDFGCRRCGAYPL